MIKIHLTEEQIADAQNKHWKWFKLKCYPNIEKSLNNKELNKDINGNVSKKAKEETNKLLKELIENDNERLRNLVIGNPNKLKNEIKYILDNYSELFYYPPTQISITKENWQSVYDDIVKNIKGNSSYCNLTTKNCKSMRAVKDLIKDINNTSENTDINKILEFIFSYDTFSKKEGDWNAYQWVKYLDLKTCPYCNRHFINYYWNEKDIKTMRPALDHFYPKGKYPFIGVSLFNLIPSCYVCNSSFKGEIDFFKQEHINPFDEEFGKDCKFTTDFKRNDNNEYDINYLISVTNNFELELKITPSCKKEKQERLIKSKKTFKLDEMYLNHKDYAQEIIQKTIIYNKTRIDDLIKSFDFELFSDKKDLMQLIMGNYMNKEQQGQRILAKLTQDVFDEFKIEDILKENIKK